MEDWPVLGRHDAHGREGQSGEERAANAAGTGEREKALELSRALRERHYNTAGELLGTGVFTQFHAELEAEFDALDELLRGVHQRRSAWNIGVIHPLLAWQPD